MMHIMWSMCLPPILICLILPFCFVYVVISPCAFLILLWSLYIWWFPKSVAMLWFLPVLGMQISTISLIRPFPIPRPGFHVWFCFINLLVYLPVVWNCIQSHCFYSSINSPLPSRCCSHSERPMSMAHCSQLTHFWHVPPPPPLLHNKAHFCTLGCTCACYCTLDPTSAYYCTLGRTCAHYGALGHTRAHYGALWHTRACYGTLWSAMEHLGILWYTWAYYDTLGHNFFNSFAHWFTLSRTFACSFTLSRTCADLCTLICAFAHSFPLTLSQTTLSHCCTFSLGHNQSHFCTFNYTCTLIHYIFAVCYTLWLSMQVF